MEFSWRMPDSFLDEELVINFPSYKDGISYPDY